MGLFDQTTLPKVFLAYPSEEDTADGMKRLADELSQRGITVTTWQEITNPGFLFDPIRAAIEEADIILAETTSANPNVLFELGYAIAKSKITYPLFNTNAADSSPLPPLELVRLIRYAQRKDILEFLETVDLSGPTLAKQLGLEFRTGQPGGLYFIPSRRGGDVNDTILRLCGDSVFTTRTIDIHDSEYHNLTTQATSIAEAELFVTLLVSESTTEYWRENSQTMLFTGLAAGLGKDFVILAHDPLKRLLDLGERRIPFTSESIAEFRFRAWMKRTASAHLKSARPRASIGLVNRSPLAGLFLGSLDARADFDLSTYFIETPEFHQAEIGNRHLFIGSKGSGKTANFENLRTRFDRRNCVVVSVAPTDFEFPRLTAVFDEQLSLAHWQFVYGSFWRFIFITEILRSIQSKFFDQLLQHSESNYASESKYARELIRWMNENNDLLTLDFVSRVTATLSQISNIEGNDETKRTKLEEILQAARMYDIEKHLKDFAERWFEIRLIVDDLDRNWSPSNPSASRLILSLLNEIHTLMTRFMPNLKPAVFIRKDVFNWMRDHDQEILKRDPGLLQWSQEGLEILIATRIAKHTGTTEKDPTALWNLVFPQYTRGERTQDFIISRTLMRPRDVIQFCQKAVEFAQRAGRPSVSEDDVYNAWEPSGELILAQAETEHQHRYPGLGIVALAFFEAPVAQKAGDALSRIRRAINNSPLRVPWIDNALTTPTAFVEALYITGVIGVETPSGSRWFESSRTFADIPSSMSENTTVVVHPAFHRYLRCWGT